MKTPRRDFLRKLASVSLLLPLKSEAARLFTAANSDKLITASCPLTGYPFTMAIWANVTASAGTGTFISVCNTTTSWRAQLLHLSGGTIQLQYNQSAIYTTTAQTISQGEWHHVACTISTSGGTVTAYHYIDGVQSTVSSGADGQGSAIWNAIGIGARYNSTWGTFLSGSLEMAAIWDRVLSVTDIQQLAGRGPSAIGGGIHPLGLAGKPPIYLNPIQGEYHQKDMVNGLSATATGTSTATTGPRIIQ